MIKKLNTWLKDEVYGDSFAIQTILNYIRASVELKGRSTISNNSSVSVSGGGQGNSSGGGGGQGGSSSGSLSLSPVEVSWCLPQLLQLVSKGINNTAAFEELPIPLLAFRVTDDEAGEHSSGEEHSHYSYSLLPAPRSINLSKFMIENHINNYVESGGNGGNGGSKVMNTLHPILSSVQSKPLSRTQSYLQSNVQSNIHSNVQFNIQSDLKSNIQYSMESQSDKKNKRNGAKSEFFSFLVNTCESDPPLNSKLFWTLRSAAISSIISGTVYDNSYYLMEALIALVVRQVWTDRTTEKENPTYSNYMRIERQRRDDCARALSVIFSPISVVLAAHDDLIAIRKMVLEILYHPNAFERHNSMVEDDDSESKSFISTSPINSTNGSNNRNNGNNGNNNDNNRNNYNGNNGNSNNGGNNENNGNTADHKYSKTVEFQGLPYTSDAFYSEPKGDDSPRPANPTHTTHPSPAHPSPTHPSPSYPSFFDKIRASDDDILCGGSEGPWRDIIPSCSLLSASTVYLLCGGQVEGIDMTHTAQTTQNPHQYNQVHHTTNDNLNFLSRISVARRYLCTDEQSSLDDLLTSHKPYRIEGDSPGDIDGGGLDYVLESSHNGGYNEGSSDGYMGNGHFKLYPPSSTNGYNDNGNNGDIGGGGTDNSGCNGTIGDSDYAIDEMGLSTLTKQCLLIDAIRAAVEEVRSSFSLSEQHERRNERLRAALRERAGPISTMLNQNKTLKTVNTVNTAQTMITVNAVNTVKRMATVRTVKSESVNCEVVSSSSSSKCDIESGSAFCVGDDTIPIGKGIKRSDSNDTNNNGGGTAEQKGTASAATPTPTTQSGSHIDNCVSPKVPDIPDGPLSLWPIPSMFHPTSVVLTGLDIEKCRVLRSSKYPALLVFHYHPAYRKNGKNGKNGDNGNDTALIRPSHGYNGSHNGADNNNDNNNNNNSNNNDDDKCYEEHFQGCYQECFQESYRQIPESGPGSGPGSCSRVALNDIFTPPTPSTFFPFPSFPPIPTSITFPLSAPLTPSAPFPPIPAYIPSTSTTSCTPCTLHTSPPPYMALYKQGDDVRQDELAIQLIRFMDLTLKGGGMDLRLMTYEVLSLGPREGLIQWIEGAQPLSAIIDGSCTLPPHNQDKSPTSSPPGTNPILAYLRYHSHCESSEFGVGGDVMETFLRSCAGYSVITYILGVGDRHMDNLMLMPTGHFFHVDYGFLFGRDPKPFRPLVRFTGEMLGAMGGPDHALYQRFLTLCCSAYNIHRASSGALLALIYLVAEAGIQDLSEKQTPTEAISGVISRLHLDLSDTAAGGVMRGVLAESAAAIMPRVLEQMHRIASTFR